MLESNASLREGWHVLQLQEDATYMTSCFESIWAQSNRNLEAKVWRILPKMREKAYQPNTLSIYCHFITWSWPSMATIWMFLSLTQLPAVGSSGSAFGPVNFLLPGEVLPVRMGLYRFTGMMDPMRGGGLSSSAPCRHIAISATSSWRSKGRSDRERWQEEVEHCLLWGCWNESNGTILLIPGSF